MQALLVADPHDITPGERMLAGALAGASAQVIAQYRQIYSMDTIRRKKRLV